MATQVVMPKLSPTMEEGQLARWLKKEGDKVSMGEPLAEIDTDKATMEMQALSNGVLRKILVQEGESAPLGQPIAIVGEADEDISALLEKSRGKAASAPATRQQEPAAAPEPAEKPSPPAPAVSPDGKQAEAAAAGGGTLFSPAPVRKAPDAAVRLDSPHRDGAAGHILQRQIDNDTSDYKR